MNPAAVSRFRARALLAECDSWPKDKFLEAWAEALPSGMEVDMTQLDGLAVTLPPTPKVQVGKKQKDDDEPEEQPRLQGYRSRRSPSCQRSASSPRYSY